jgi:hypothetical protein
MTSSMSRHESHHHAVFVTCMYVTAMVLTTPALASTPTTTTALPGPRAHFVGVADTPIGAPACGFGQVVVSASPPVSASTHRAIPLNFGLAAGANPCSLTGYPGVDSGSGGPLIRAERTPRGFLGGLHNGVDEPPTVILWPSALAHAVVEGRAVDAHGDQCPTYTDLRVTPPNTTQTITVAATIDACMLAIHPVTGD